jgi:hypothetical protein
VHCNLNIRVACCCHYCHGRCVTSPRSELMSCFTDLSKSQNVRWYRMCPSALARSILLLAKSCTTTNPTNPPRERCRITRIRRLYDNINQIKWIESIYNSYYMASVYHIESQQMAGAHFLTTDDVIGWLLGGIVRDGGLWGGAHR